MNKKPFRRKTGRNVMVGAEGETVHQVAVFDGSRQLKLVELSVF